MRKMLVSVVVLLGIVALVGGVAVATLAVMSNRLDVESKQYADAAIEAIVREWNPHDLWKRASDELKSTTNESNVATLFATFKTLGRLIRYNGASGESTIYVTFESPLTITALYRATAEFENGPGEILVKLVKHQEAWQILKFRVNSKVFLEQTKN